MSNERKTKRSKEVLLAEAQERVAKLMAQIDGTYVRENEEKTGIKAVRFALKRRKTELHRATVLVNGRAATAKSPALAGIHEKIANAGERLEKLREAAWRGEDFMANLPFDIGRLDALLQLAETEGEEIEVPTGMFKIGGEDERTEAEIEAKVVTSDDAEVTENAN